MSDQMLYVKEDGFSTACLHLNAGRRKCVNDVTLFSYCAIFPRLIKPILRCCGNSFHRQMNKMKSINRQINEHGIEESGNRITKGSVNALIKSNPILLVIFTSLLFVSLASCNSIKVVTSWREPDASVSASQLNKFVVAALLKNQAVRRKTEDLMAADFPGKAVQSYKELGETELKENNEFYNQKLKGEGFDGMVVMRLLQVDKNKRYVPGNYPDYYHTWGLYYTAAWTGFFTPGYYATDKIFDVEVNVYSFKRGKLIWSATTSTVNPAGSDELYDDVIKAVKKRMKKEGFLK
jgi:hypothetical protein